MIPRGSETPSTEQRIVLKTVGAAALARLGGEAGLRKKLRLIEAADDPHWLRWMGFDVVTEKLMREWVNGFTLQDMLRRRRKLAPKEVLKLCDCLPATLSKMEDAGLRIPYPLLNEVFVVFDEEIDHQDWLDEEVLDWPDFSLKVNPLQMTGSGCEGGTLLDGSGTLATAFTGDASPRESLAELVYESLGGDGASEVGQSRSPLAALNEAANLVLSDGLCGTCEASVSNFWKIFIRSIEERSVFEAKIVPGKLNRKVLKLKAHGQPQRGSLLRLRPMEKGTLSIYVTAKPRLRIGRESGVADVVTRFMPETEANARLTDHLGRVHVIGRRVDGWPCFWDGDGRERSVNGASLDEEPLDAEAGKRCAPESRLRLGREYRLRVTCVDEERIELQFGGEIHETVSDDCTVLFNASGQPMIRLVAWIGGSAGLEIAKHGLTWSHKGAVRSDAALLHSEGGFWLANLALSRRALRIDGTAVDPGCAVALCDGQEVSVETACYKLRIGQ